MPISNEPSNQPSKPRKSTRGRKAVAGASETEVPLTTAAEGNGAATRATSSATEPSSQPDDLAERIRQRAYEIYLARGNDNGNEIDDWLEAERQLRSGSGPSDVSESDTANA